MEYIASVAVPACGCVALTGAAGVKGTAEGNRGGVNRKPYSVKTSNTELQRGFRNAFDFPHARQVTTLADDAGLGRRIINRMNWNCNWFALVFDTVTS